MSKVRVNLGERSYDIHVGETGGLASIVRERTPASMALVVTDANVAEHAGGLVRQLKAIGFKAEMAVLPAGEGQKALGVAASLYNRLVDLRADRQTLIVAVGGGVVGDLAGFVAATFNRGLPLLMVPTTLLAMVDSSVGGKVGVNHPRGKNLIGAFHQPIGVWIDPAVLTTLPDREYRSGLAEVVKYGVILDPDLLSILESQVNDLLQRKRESVAQVVARSCRLKADIVEKDEYERTGLRAALNYGHTFAHAFETVAGYGAWLHGEAVAAGMVCASRLAERRGMIDAKVTARQRDILAAFNLPIRPGAWPIDDLVAAMRLDKKNQAGKLRFVLPTRLGEVGLVDDVAEEDVRQVLQENFPSGG
jgi:3-dehydroquinate synthase